MRSGEQAASENAGRQGGQGRRRRVSPDSKLTTSTLLFKVIIIILNIKAATSKHEILTRKPF